MAERFQVKPTKKLRALVEIYGGVNPAAVHWGVEFGSLQRFLDGKAMLSLPSAGKIVESTGLSYEELFEHDVKASNERA